MVYPALLRLMSTPRLPVLDWTDAPADLNGLVRFAERRNLVSARVPSHFKRSQTRNVGMRLPVVASPTNNTAQRTSRLPYFLKHDSSIVAKLVLLLWNWQFCCWFLSRIPLSLSFSHLNSMYNLFFPVSSTQFHKICIMFSCFAGFFTSTSTQTSPAWGPKVTVYNSHMEVIQAWKALKGVTSRRNCRDVLTPTPSTLGLWLTPNKWHSEAAHRS